ncbi:hypothetical protein H4R19_003542 [Coemansia spiralis]|nr:hypothetical protein H4R19_003542 [Coemansia spiralis]
MRYWAVAGALVLGAAAARSAAGNGDGPRDLTAGSFTQFKGGLLYKNGVQTSCEVGLIDFSAAFVAANCLNYTGGGNMVDASVKYSVWLYNSADGTSVIRATVDPMDIRVHPKYDAKTLANNIAVVQFNKGVVAPYTSYINTDLNLTGSQQGYVRRTFNDSQGAWNPVQLSLQSSDSGGCAESSALYGQNPGWLACTGAVTSSVYLDSCGVPFGTLYYATDGQIVLSAIFSHAVVHGTSTCGGGPGTVWRSYFTQLWPHVGLAVSVLGRPINTYVNLAPVVAVNRDIHAMTVPTNTAPPSGAVVVGGNFYGFQGAKQDEDGESSSGDESSSSSRAEASSDTEEPGSSHGSSGALDADDSSSGGGFTKTQKIIVGVVVPIGAILIGIGAFLLYRIWAAKRQDHAWDPRANMVQLQSAASEIAQPGLLTPPAYADAVLIPPLQAAPPLHLSGSPPKEKPSSAGKS